MNARPYKGALITPSDSAQWRWQSYVEGAGFLYADTLAGIRALITRALARPVEYHGPANNRKTAPYGTYRDYPKIDIFRKSDGQYMCSTNWARNCKEALWQYADTDAHKFTARYA